MKDSNLVAQPFPARVWCLFIAAAALPAVAMSAPTPQLLTAEVVTVSGANAGITSLNATHSNKAGHWVAEGNFTTASTQSSVFYGVLPGSGATPSVLRTAQTINGYQQLAIFGARVHGSGIAYKSAEPSPVTGFSSWINDQLVATPGDLIGSTGLEWTGSGTPLKAPGPRFFVRGGVRAAGTQGGSVQVVVRYPAETIELAVGDVGLGLSGPVTRIQAFDVHPLQSTWAAIVDYQSGTSGQVETGVVVNDVVHTTSWGSPVTTENIWDSFAHVIVNADVVVTILGRD